MATEHSNTPTTQAELEAQLNAAVNAGKYDDIDRLMAVELPEPEVVEEEPKEEETVEETTDEPVTEDETSEEVVETKDEAATDSAASKPEDTPKQPDELELLRQENHRIKSDAGRVPFLQRRLQELERELRDSKLSRKAEDPAKDSTVEAALPEALKTRIEKLKDIDPDLADLLELGFKQQTNAKTEAAKVAADMVKDFASQQDAQADQEFLQTQYNELVRRVPFADQVFKSAEWQQWKNSLPPGKRAMAESSYADDVEPAIHAFITEMRARHGGATKQPAAEQSTQVEDTKTSEAVTKVQESRERKLNASTATAQAAAKGPKPKMTDEELFKAEFDRIKKENHF